MTNNRKYWLRVAVLAVVAWMNWSRIGLGQYTIDWIRQFGTATHDGLASVSLDRFGNLYAGGATLGAFGGPHLGLQDAMVLGLDRSTGNVRWARQFGTEADEGVSGLGTDALGNVYAFGSTKGNLGGTNAGYFDPFVAKFTEQGEMLWIRQFGTSGFESVWDGTADDDGNSYAAFTTAIPGDRGDLVLAKLDTNGELVWTRQYGTPYWDDARSVAVSQSGEVFLGGLTGGILGDEHFGGLDAFLTKFDADGNRLWTRQFGTRVEDVVFGVAVDRFGNSFAVGTTQGDFAAPNGGFNSRDVIAAKFDPDGEMQWARQFGTESPEESTGAGTDAAGNVYVTGQAQGNLFGPWNGLADVFAMKLDPDGELQWGMQIGTELNEVPWWHHAVDPTGVLYVIGSTEGSLGGPTLGGSDAFVMRVSNVPEPVCGILFAPMIWLAIAARRSRHCD